MKIKSSKLSCHLVSIVSSNSGLYMLTDKSYIKHMNVNNTKVIGKCTEAFVNDINKVNLEGGVPIDGFIALEKDFSHICVQLTNHPPKISQFEGRIRSMIF